MKITKSKDKIKVLINTIHTDNEGNPIVELETNQKQLSKDIKNSTNKT